MADFCDFRALEICFGKNKSDVQIPCNINLLALLGLLE